MTEHEPHPLGAGGSPERLTRTASKYEGWIAEGITAAHTESREIDLMTARLIGHVLGRATGRTSALADFGRSGEGDYESLRDEYLPLYADPTTPPEIREWIDWLGTHLVERDHLGSGRQYMNEHLPPKLKQLLVRTDIRIDSDRFTVHVPADASSMDIAQLEQHLAQLDLSWDEALQAFLSLPHVNALTEDITVAFSNSYIATFHNLEDAVDGLLEIDEWAKDITEYANDRGFAIESLSPDYEVLAERVRDAYDLVDWRGKLYGFYK